MKLNKKIFGTGAALLCVFAMVLAFASCSNTLHNEPPSETLIESMSIADIKKFGNAGQENVYKIASAQTLAAVPNNAKIILTLKFNSWTDINGGTSGSTQWLTKSGDGFTWHDMEWGTDSATATITGSDVQAAKQYGLFLYTTHTDFTYSIKYVVLPTKKSNTQVVRGDFIKGFDASKVDYFENNLGYTWKDTDGSTQDFFEILARHGVNTIRLRLWVDPTNAIAHGLATDNEFNSKSDKNGGDNTLERTIRMAKSAKEHNFAIMLDIHYSDYWTDPSQQIIPYSWQSIKTADEMAAKISTYTKDVLNKMKAEGCLPDYVQVGNETNNGILKDTKKGTPANSGVAGTSPNFAKYLAAGCKAVKAVSSGIQVILHVTNESGKATSIITTMSSNSSDYDIIGLSYYPWEKNHGTISELKNNIKTITSKGKKAMVVETSMYWNQDETNDVVTPLNYVYQHMIDPKTSAVYTDLTQKTVGSTKTVEGSVSNQYNVIKHIMDEVKDAGGIGVCTWGGELHNKWSHGFFHWQDKKAHDSIKVFEYTPSTGGGTNGGGSGGGSTSRTLVEDLSYTANGSLQELCSATKVFNASPTSITFYVKNVKGSGTWWISYDKDGSNWVNIADNANWSNDISGYTITLTDTAIISYFKTNGIKLAMLSGLTATVTVTYN